MSRRHSVGGHSVIEMILAIALVGVVIFTVINFFPQALLSVMARDHHAQALRIAYSSLSEQAVRPYAELVAGTASDLTPVTCDQMAFSRHLEVLEVPGADVHHLLALRITVSWLSLTHASLSVVQEMEVHHLDS